MTMATDAGLWRLLLVATAAVAAFTSCSPDPGAETRPQNDASQTAGTREGHTQSPLKSLAATASKQAQAVERSGPPYSLTVADEVTGDQRAIVRAFLRFAAHPTTTSASAVPFASEGVAVRFGRDRRVIVGDALARPARWFLTNGVGTSSALFVVSNSIENAQGAGRIQFVASREPMSLCSETAIAGALPGTSQLFVAPGRLDGCAQGFELTLDLDNAGFIKAVGLLVRAP